MSDLFSVPEVEQRLSLMDHSVTGRAVLACLQILHNTGFANYRAREST